VRDIKLACRKDTRKPVFGMTVKAVSKLGKSDTLPLLSIRSGEVFLNQNA
jgi:hypothetical protein